MGNTKEALFTFFQMLQEGVQPDRGTCYSTLRAAACIGVLTHGKQIHDYIIKSGYESDIYVGNGLIYMYTNCGSMNDAHGLFAKMANRSLISWNMLISGYAKCGQSEDAVGVFWGMIWEGLIPNRATVLGVVKACAGLGCPEKSNQIHDFIIESGFEPKLFIGSALINMYAKCGSLEHARQVFDRLVVRNVVSWTAMIAGYVQHGKNDEALKLFWQMEKEGIRFNQLTFVSILKACCGAAALESGRQIHVLIRENGYGWDGILQSSLVDMYARLGSIEEARYVFDQMSGHDVIAWNGMISGYVMNGFVEGAIGLFVEMEERGVKPNEITIASILKACASLQAIEKGKQLYSQIIENAMAQNIFVNNTLLDMYIKCGFMEDACTLFNQMDEKDAVSWNVVIAGHYLHGNMGEVLVLFWHMQQKSVHPDGITFSSVLQACANLGALELGKRIHARIIGRGYAPDVSAWNTVIDMYAKGGNLDFALQVFHDMPKRSIVSWNATISGFAQHGHGRKALELVEQMQLKGMRLDHVTFVGILSACSHAGLVEEGRHFFAVMICEYGITPTVEHYVCMVDLLGRAGQLKEAEKYVKQMRPESSAVVWNALLGACRIHGDMELSRLASEWVPSYL